jgi:endonuclease YncB( thermonuclease family)
MLNWIKSILFFRELNKPVLTRAITDYGSFKNVEYVKNYDGDTITVNIKNLHPLIGNNINIRVNGIDTPEMRGGCEKSKALAIEAKLVVQELLTNAKQISLVNCTRGKYFRICSDVYADNINIASLLIAKGLAVRYDGAQKATIGANNT